MAYIDGFVLPVKKSKLAAYRTLAKKASKIWCELGAVEYVECVFDDPPKGLLSIPKAIKAKADETVVFAWIVYKSKAHRDRTTAKIMADTRLMDMCKGPMPFDVKRMGCSGFNVMVHARAKTAK